MITFVDTIDLGDHKITGLAEPTEDGDAATKAYVDANAGGGGGGGDVVSVNGKVGIVVLVPADIGAATAGDLDNVFTIASEAEPGFPALPNTTDYWLLTKQGSTPTRDYLAAVSGAATASTIAMRNAAGQVLVPVTPTANGHAASKQYADGVAASYLGGRTGAGTGGNVLTTNGAGTYTWEAAGGGSGDQIGTGDIYVLADGSAEAVYITALESTNSQIIMQAGDTGGVALSPYLSVPNVVLTPSSAAQSTPGSLYIPDSSPYHLQMNAGDDGWVQILDSRHLVVLDSGDPIPEGTPAGAVIIRKEA